MNLLHWISTDLLSIDAGDIFMLAFFAIILVVFVCIIIAVCMILFYFVGFTIVNMIGKFGDR